MNPGHKWDGGKMGNFVPIALFVYKRLWQTKQVIEALKKNELSKDSELFIFSDGYKNDEDRERVKTVRQYIRMIDGFKNITIIERDKNFGLANSAIAGISEVINRYGKVIIVEDDNFTSKYFLKYMNDALLFYEDEKKVVVISGYMYPIKKYLPPTFFIRGVANWGVGTWKKGWDLFEPDAKKLLDELRKKKLTRQFDLDGAYPFTKMLKAQALEKINSWTIRWHASAFLEDKLTLYPAKSLVRNIGFDSSGTHCGSDNAYDTTVVTEPVIIEEIPIEESVIALKETERFFKSIKPNIFKRIANKWRNILKRWDV